MYNSHYIKMITWGIFIYNLDEVLLNPGSPRMRQWPTTNFNQKQVTLQGTNPYPTKREVRKIIDSKCHFWGIFFSFPGGYLPLLSKNLVGGWTNPTHPEKNMRKSNWIEFPQFSGRTYKKFKTTTHAVIIPRIENHLEFRDFPGDRIMHVGWLWAINTLIGTTSSENHRSRAWSLGKIWVNFKFDTQLGTTYHEQHLETMYWNYWWWRRTPKQPPGIFVKILEIVG